MNAVIHLPSAPLDLAHPLSALQPPLEAILAASGPAFMGVFAPGGEQLEPSTLRDGIRRAEAFLEGCSAHAAALREAAELMPVDDIGVQLGLFVTAWPNSSSADLRGYGPQLAEDVIERRPCRYALRSALGRLRQTSRFLPAIAEVLAALDEAQGRVRNTLWHAGQLPAELDRARAALAAADRRAAEQTDAARRPGMAAAGTSPDAPAPAQEDRIP